MRLLKFFFEGEERCGVFTERGIFDLRHAGVRSLGQAIAEHTVDGLMMLAEQGDAFIQPDKIVFLPPVAKAARLVCVGTNYRSHAEQLGGEIPSRPTLFVRFEESVVGHEQPIEKPNVSAAYDFEGEVAVVIGKAGRHIAVETALDHVFGYTCFAENSVRDWQRHSAQATAGKNFDRSGAIGPWITTSDEIGPVAAHTLVTRLNGEEVQRSGLDDLIFSMQDIIAYTSTFMKLQPGDVIATGTPAGIGAMRRPPLWMKPGDVLEVEFSGIGTLRNHVIQEQE